jgi:glycosyltransferase involved in cell wall biosynthesis
MAARRGHRCFSARTRELVPAARERAESQGHTAVSAVVCTRNRAPQLAHALDSLCRQVLDHDLFEVVVVDDGSRDRTREVVERFQSGPITLRYVTQPQQGLSVARNLGAKLAKGSVIAYLDDDAIAAPDWLTEICKAFSESRPRPSCVGGKVLPIWGAPLPGWFPRQYLSSLTILDKGETMRELTEDEALVGANIAFDREALYAVGGFDPRFTLYGDEIMVLQRMHDREMSIVYAPRVIVEHHVPPRRLTVSYLTKRKYLGARGEFLVLLHGKRDAKGRAMFVVKQLMGRPPQILFLLSRLLWATLKGADLERVRLTVSVARSAGMLMQAMRVRSLRTVL